MKNMKNIFWGINLPIKARCHESGVALIDEEGNVVFVSLKKDFPEKT